MRLFSVKIPEIVPEGNLGVAKIEHFTVSDRDATFAALRDPSFRADTYAKLTVGRRLMMTDTQHERNTNMEFVRKATGDVLIAGLGLGLIILALKDKADVTSITVVEKYPDVVALVAPALRKEGCKFQVIEADILDWKPPKGVQWDTIYFDIWPDICVDNLTEITKLKRKFGRRLNRANSRAWMGAWVESRLRAQKRRDDKVERYRW